jgi:hypothetical protein
VIASVGALLRRRLVFAVFLLIRLGPAAFVSNVLDLAGWQASADTVYGVHVAAPATGSAMPLGIGSFSAGGLPRMTMVTRRV